MKTPQEKATALYNMFYNSISNYGQCETEREADAIKQAIDCVDEIQDALEEQGLITHSNQEYYNQIRDILYKSNKEECWGEVFDKFQTEKDIDTMVLEEGLEEWLNENYEIKEK